MHKFETQFENLDVHTSVMEGAMSSATTLSTPADQVDDLMKKVAEENGLDVLDKLKEAQVGQTLPSGTVQEDEALTRRLASLRDNILEDN